MTVKERAKAGEAVCGCMIRVTKTTAIAALAKRAGLDFIMFDCEHGSFSLETLHDVFLVANALGLDAWARVPVAEKDYASRVLDCGGSGIMVPMTETPEQARQLVKYSKYPPLGDRGFSNGAHTLYQGGKHHEIMETANRRVMSIAQIETRLGVENVKAIAAVEGIDALIVGPNDLSIALGVPGELTNPILVDAVKKVAAACRECGKLFTVHSEPRIVDQFRDDISFVMQLGDTDFTVSGMKGVRQYCDDWAKKS